MPKATLSRTEKRVTITKNGVTGILNYDVDNAYPQRIEEIVNNSGTGSASVGMKARFLMGGGFTNEDFAETVINEKGQTADKLLRETAKNMSYLPLIAIHINYNGLFEKVNPTLVPFQNVRLTTRDAKKHANKVALYDNWDKTNRASRDQKKVDYIHFYNPDPEVIEKQVEEAGGWAKYKGQILFVSPNGKAYTLADFDSILEDMQTDSKTKTFKFRNVTNNFMASHILITDAIQGDENGEEADLFQETLKDFQGAEDAMQLLWIEKKTEESTIELEKVEIQDVDKLYEYTEDSVKKNIRDIFLQPEALFERSTNKLGSGDELADAVEYYNAIIYHEQLILEEIFRTVFTNFHENVNPSEDYTIIPFVSPVPKKVDVKTNQAITEVIKDTELSKEEKVDILVMLYNVSEKNAEKLAKEKTKPAAEPNPAKE